MQIETPARTITLNDAQIANMTDNEFLNLVDACEHPVVVELARRLTPKESKEMRRYVR